MAHLPAISNDVFISYAHEGSTGSWAAQFHRRLFTRNFLPTDLDSTGANRWLADDEQGLKQTTRRLELPIDFTKTPAPVSLWARQIVKGALRSSCRTRISAIKATKTPVAGDRHRDIFGTGYKRHRRDAQTAVSTRLHLTSQEFESSFLYSGTGGVYELEIVRAWGFDS